MASECHLSSMFSAIYQFYRFLTFFCQLHFCEKKLTHPEQFALLYIRHAHYNVKLLYLKKKNYYPLHVAGTWFLVCHCLSIIHQHNVQVKQNFNTGPRSKVHYCNHSIHTRQWHATSSVKRLKTHHITLVWKQNITNYFLLTVYSLFCFVLQKQYAFASPFSFTIFKISANFQASGFGT